MRDTFMRELLVVHLVAMFALALWVVPYVARYRVFPAGFVPLAGIVILSTALSVGLHTDWDVGAISLGVVGGAMLLLRTVESMLTAWLDRYDTNRSLARRTVPPEERGR